VSSPEFPVRVLVVDDSTMMRALIRRALQGRPGWSAEVIEAGDGVEALQLIRNPKLGIDVVLLDWNMPRLDGIGFLKALKASRSAGEVSVIMVTTQSQQSSVAEALRWGARDYLLKPFKEDTLRERVERLSSRATPPASDTAMLLRKAAGEGGSDAPYLQTIPADAAQELLLRSTVRIAPAGTLLLLAGLRTDSLGILVHGQIELREPGHEESAEVRGPGDCWGDAPFLNREASTVDVRSRTPVEYIEVPRDSFADLVRIHPSMATSLAALVARKNRKSRPAAPAEKTSDLSGRIEVVPISDLIQVLHLCRKTGHLKLTSGAARGGIFVASGELKHAWTDGVEGEEALYALMGWSDGTFLFESGAPAGTVTLTQPTMMLVMESARRVDERRRADAARPETT
jgi:two-component system, chemotaxis family, chemotaxis protein CheY